MSDLADQARECVAGGTPIVEYGKAHADFGHAPPAEHATVQLPTGVMEHYRRDLTVRVAAGCTVGELQEALRASNQFAPIDVDDDITVGEAITCNMYGALRQSYGAMRDQLLGLGYVDGEGREIRVGGRTVKNVAGLDVTRFMVGSLGEFGMVDEATLRTAARPEHVLSVVLELDRPTRLDYWLSEWLLTDAAPTWMSLQRENSRWAMYLSYFGTSTACVTQLRSLETLLTRAEGVHIQGTQESTLDRDQQDRGNHRAWRRSTDAVVKVLVPPSVTAAVCERIAAFETAHPTCDHLHIDALPTHGCIFAGCRLSGKGAAELDRRIAAATDRFDGVRQWIRRPANHNGVEPVSPLPLNMAMLRRLKRVMDPHGILNPGRFVTIEEAVAVHG